jgi:hypothetical protein
MWNLHASISVSIEQTLLSGFMWNQHLITHSAQTRGSDQQLEASAAVGKEAAFENRLWQMFESAQGH